MHGSWSNGEQWKQMKGVTHSVVLTFVLKIECCLLLCNMGKNRKVCRCTVTPMHRHECAHALVVVDMDMHAHYTLWLSPPVVETKKLQECTQIAARRQEEKWGREGGIIKQEST